ncbi:hypothetical protein O9H85_02345 [Paenibacillus filicis]|uniref:DUF11 domain-containing protein n=1 Tax=Paenibacillus gyeongsangnamensis TaxID=3388067 RepID=A0ABT4Q3E3_9BACL|nr:hypothetical protein [Paenibacillus filicis]MCZ8511297.1 hypothetical protein [Paenibacillus filicis]
MNKKLQITVASVVIGASLLSTGYTVRAAEGTTQEATATVSPSYKLTDSLDVEVKTVLNEHVLDGTRLGVVIRMKNNSDSITRVPDTIEVRVKTTEGTTYTLQASASNVKSIQPKASSELSYLSVIDRTDDVTLSEVNWTDVDYYVYPKKETVVVTAPITTQPWKGSDAPITDPSAVKKWSESFKIPSLLSPLQYTPIGISKESSDKGNVIVVQLLAYNPTGQRETLPDFQIDGKTEGKIFSGKRVEQGTIVLEGKEEKYIHYAIPVDPDTELTSLNLLTAEKFAQAGQGQSGGLLSYNVGRLNILLPSGPSASAFESYVYGNPLKFDKRSNLIQSDLEVTLAEFTIQDNTDEGSKNVTAKFKLNNKGDRPLAVPVFQTDLLSSDGYTYSGARQNLTTPSILPNSGVTVSYSFKVPGSETGKGLALKIQDAVSAAPYKTTIASYAVELQPVSTNDEFSVYPFFAKIRSWDITGMFNRQGTLQYTYKAKFMMDLKRDDQMQVDQSSSKLQFELYDSLDRLIGTSQASFIGPNRLVTGENNIMFSGSSEQFDHPLTIRVYEYFTTATGDSKRLLAVFKQ